MTDLRKAAEMALEMFDWLERRSMYQDLQMKETHEALRQALAEQEPWVKTYSGGKPNYCTPVDAVNMSQDRVDETAKREHEPVAFVNGYFGGYLTITCFDSTLVLPDGLALYTAPLKREWVCLTEDELEDLEFASVDREYGHLDIRVLSRAIEAKLREKNGG